jgi:Putative phage abortive infection protein
MRKKRRKPRTWIVVGSTLLFGIVGSIVVAYFWTALFPRLIPARATTQPAPAIGVGEQFEVLTAIFTLVAFVGVIATLLFQWSETEGQRMEAARDQVRSEAFQLMGAWQTIVHNTRLSDADGRQAFNLLNIRLSSVLFNDEQGGKKALRPPLSRNDIEKFYRGFYQGEVSAALGNYFRFLYHIIRYVKRSQLDTEDKKDLVRLVRAHLSDPELNLLFWNGLTSYAGQMYGLIEEFDLLQNFSFTGILEAEMKLYPKTFERWAKERERKAAMQQ